MSRSSFKKNQIRLAGTKRPRIRIGIIRTRRTPVERVVHQMGIWLANAMTDEWDVKPYVVPLVPDEEVQLSLKKMGLKILPPGPCNSIWSFGLTAKTAKKLAEIMRDGKRDLRIVIFPETLPWSPDPK